MAIEARITASRAIRICSSQACRSTAGNPIRAISADGGSVGGSYLFDGGYVGVAVVQNNALYHIPGIDGAENQTRIDARQTKVTSKGEYRPYGTAIDTVRFWLGVTDYKHNELGLADPADPFSDGIRQTFTNKEQEGRLEVTFLPFDLRFAALTTALGVQAGHQDLTAPGDTPGQFSGLFDPNHNSRSRRLHFQRVQVHRHAQGAARGPHRKHRLEWHHAEFSRRTSCLTVATSSLSRAISHFTSEERQLRRDPEPSVGSRRQPDGAACRARAEAGGAVLARPARRDRDFDIGNPNLKIEVANSIEVGLAPRGRAVPLRSDRLLHAVQRLHLPPPHRRDLCDETSTPAATPRRIQPGGLFAARRDLPRRRVPEPARCYAAARLASGASKTSSTSVRATFTDGTNVPRIPPVRLGGGVFWRDANWLARVNLLHAFAHTDVEVTPTFTETPTAGYNNLRAEVSYRWRLKLATWGPTEALVGVAGNNLLNDDIRNSVSFTKDEVLMPGRSVRVFANVKF